MNTEDIIRMAREAGVDNSWDLNWFDPYYERFANLVAAAEREACANICQAESEYAETWGTWAQVMTADKCATAIRKRGKE